MRIISMIFQSSQPSHPTQSDANRDGILHCLTNTYHQPQFWTTTHGPKLMAFHRLFVTIKGSRYESTVFNQSDVVKDSQSGVPFKTGFRFRVLAKMLANVCFRVLVKNRDSYVVNKVMEIVRASFSCLHTFPKPRAVANSNNCDESDVIRHYGSK